MGWQRVVIRTAVGKRQAYKSCQSIWLAYGGRWQAVFKNITNAGTATPITLRLRLHFMGAHAAGVRSRKNSMPPKQETEIIENEAGMKLAEVQMVDGKPHGKTRQWSESGVLTLEAEMEDGKYHGSYKSWWPNGNLKEVGNYSKGKRVGSYLWYKQTGELCNEHSYE